MKQPKDRKAAQRQRDRAAGLIEVTVKIPATKKQQLLEFVREVNL
jgi:hypothetical protein